MPTYDYRCEKGHRFELFHGIKDESPKACPKCGSPAKRVPSSGGGLLFKGSGFYITENRSKQYRERAKAEKSGGDSSSGGASKSGGDSSAGKPAGGSTPGGSASSGKS